MRQLSVGVTTCVALTEDGEALSWGRGVGGRPAALPTPTPLPELHGRAVLGVCCGPAQVSHTTAVDQPRSVTPGWSEVPSSRWEWRNTITRFCHCHLNELQPDTDPSAIIRFSETSFAFAFGFASFIQLGFV